MHTFLGRHWRQRISFGIWRNKSRPVFCSAAKAALVQQGSGVQLPNCGWATAPSHGHCMIIMTPARPFFFLFLWGFFFLFPLMKLLLNSVWTKDHSGITFKPNNSLKTRNSYRKVGLLSGQKNPWTWKSTLWNQFSIPKKHPKKNKEVSSSTSQ